MPLQKRPRLFRGGFSGRVFVTSSYTTDSSGNIVSHVKFDVTEDFNRLMLEEIQRKAEQELAAFFLDQDTPTNDKEAI